MDAQAVSHRETKQGLRQSFDIPALNVPAATGRKER